MTYLNKTVQYNQQNITELEKQRFQICCFKLISETWSNHFEAKTIFTVFFIYSIDFIQFKSPDP